MKEGRISESDSSKIVRVQSDIAQREKKIRDQEIMFQKEIARLQQQAGREDSTNSNLKLEIKELKSRLDKNEEIYQRIGAKLNLF